MLTEIFISESGSYLILKNKIIRCNYLNIYWQLFKINSIMLMKKLNQNKSNQWNSTSNKIATQLKAVIPVVEEVSISSFLTMQAPFTIVRQSLGETDRIVMSFVTSTIVDPSAADLFK